MVSLTLQSTKTLTNNGRRREGIVNCVKTTLFILAICTTLTLSSLPIIFYYVTIYTDYFAVQQSNNNTTQNPVNLTLTSCETIDGSWGIVDVAEPSVCELYSGTLCLPYLRKWQECLLPMSTELRIVTTDNTRTQIEIENRINELQVLLSSLGQTFAECMERVIPFICHYYFPIVQDCQSSMSFQSTQEECMDIENNICQQAIAAASLASIDIPIELPSDCAILPHGNGTDSTSNSSAMMTTNNSVLSNITCRDDFILSSNSVCVPRCDRFEANSHSLVTARIISEVLGAALGVLVSSICIILSVYNRKIMFKFPSIFMFFLFIGVWITGVPYLITALDRTSLMCSSVNLLEAVMNPTKFCVISGAIWQYITVSLTLWWFFHLCIFFYMIMFPFHAKRMKELKRTNYLAVILTIIGVLVPLPAVVVSLVLDQYRLGDFPPTVCIYSSTVWFYSGNMVVCPLFAIGTSILIIVFWKIHKNQFTHAKQNGEQKFTTAEKKLMFASVCYIIFGAIVIVYYSVANGDQNKALEALTEYFTCESTGHVPGKCDRSKFERYIHTELQIFANLSMGLLSLGILNFVVSWQKLGKSIKAQLKKIQKGSHIGKLVNQSSANVTIITNHHISCSSSDTYPPKSTSV